MHPFSLPHRHLPFVNSKVNIILPVLHPLPNCTLRHGLKRTTKRFKYASCQSSIRVITLLKKYTYSSEALGGLPAEYDQTTF